MTRLKMEHHSESENDTTEDGTSYWKWEWHVWRGNIIIKLRMTRLKMEYHSESENDTTEEEYQSESENDTTEDGTL